PVIRADLMCYVCDDCAQLPKDARLLACNEDFFNSGGITEASTVTTTTPTEPPTTPEEPTTLITPTEPMTTSVESTTVTTEAATASTTVEPTTNEPTTLSTQSTEPPAPTPPTAGPVETTSAVPTPPAEDNLFRLTSNSTRLVPVGSESTEPIPVRRRRAAIESGGYTYHCYSVQVAVNATTKRTNRGCSRVTVDQGVCELLKTENNNTELATCDPCSMNACNGSSMLQHSVLASLLVALVAFGLQRN
ncbi:hypothetical protein KR018_001635, partial [Drosophila ironensis]